LADSTVVLWISRHEPTQEMLESLNKSLGDFSVVMHRRDIGRTKSLSTILDVHKPDRVIATLPIDMQEALTYEIYKRGLRPLIRPVYHHRRTAGEFIFKGFEEVLELSVRTRPLEAL
jgi:hypothetical protein